MWILFGLLSAFFAALVTVIGKIALKSIDPLFLNTLRAIFMTIVLLLATIITNKIDAQAFSKLSKIQLIVIIFAALAGALSWIFYFIGLKLTTRTSALAALDKSSILLIPLLAFFFLHEPVGLKTILGGILIFAGIILMNI